MTRTLAQFNQLIDAEEYFEFFGLDYDPQVVNVNRLHILQLFSNRLQEIAPTPQTATESERLNQYRLALQQAYEVFVDSNAREQKLFKVFNEQPKNFVAIGQITQA